MRGILLRSIGALVLLSFSVSIKAAIVAVTLDTATVDYSTGMDSPVLSGTLTGSYNTTTGVVTMDSGTTTMSFVSDFGWAYDHLHTNWSTGAGTYSASAFSCVEGTAGATVLVNFCAGTSFGGNVIDESSVDYSSIPGILSIGGDDFATGTAGTVQGAWFAMDTDSLVGSTLTMQTSNWDSGTTGTQLVFTVVPIPAAAWLFGSALGLLSWMRRKAT